MAKGICYNFTLRITQLYEQGADEDRIWEYVRHWCRWVRAGVALQLKPFISVGAQEDQKHQNE